jgi:uncharacterized protein YukE
MTELKTESQSTRITQTQPTRRSKKSTSTQTTGIAAGKELSSNAESPSAEPAKKSRTARAKKTTQAATKSSSQSASTRVKLTWEPESSPSIEAAFEQFNQQLNANWVAIDELIAVVDANRLAIDELRSSVDGTWVEIDAVRTAVEKKAAPAVRPASEPPKVQERSREIDRPPTYQPAPQTTIRNPQPSIPAFRPTSGFPTSTRQRRKKMLSLFLQNILQLPTKTNEVAIDAALWVMAAAGLRVGLKYLVMVFPILELPVMLLVFVPALLAAYAALFIPKANRIGIYRLLLLALGLFVGGRL